MSEDSGQLADCSAQTELAANGRLPTAICQLQSATRQSGFVLPAAIFLLVVLSGLAAWMMQLTTSTLAQEDLEIQGARAFQAAQAGLEAGISIAAALAAGTASCAGVNQNVTFSSGTLASFSASVSCAAYPADDGSYLYRVSSIACNQPASGACPNAAPTLNEYAERQMTATVQGAAP